MGKPEILDKDISAKGLESELTSVQTHIKEEIKDLSTEMRDKLAAKYEQRVKAIKEKYKDKTETTIIPGSKDKFAKLLAQIKEEHADKNEGVDTKTDDDKTEKKLSEQEVDAALETFEKDMSPASPETPEVAPKKPEGPEAKALELAKAHFALGEGDEIKTPSKVPFNFGMAIQKWIKDIIISIKKAFGADVSDDLAQLEGYSGSEMKQKSDIVFSALSPYMGASVETLRDPKGEPKTKEESLVKLIESAGIPIKYAKSCIKYIFTGDKEILGKLPTSIKKETLMALRGNYIVKSETNDTGTLAEKSPRQKLDNIFQIEPGKTQEYIAIARAKELKDAALAHPTTTQDTTLPEPEKPRETVDIDAVIQKYQGKKYSEDSYEKGIKLRKEGDKIAVDKGTTYTEVSVNADSQLEYRGISGTQNDIMELMIMDTYVQSLPGDASRITLADKNILNGKNSIRKGPFQLKEIPSFAKNWNWQDLYNFLSRKEMAPAEREKLSGREPTPISQVDLDAILARTTDTAKNGATLIGEIDTETHEITITRTDADGKVSKESIFPLKDGKNFMVGNVTFPIFADAIKAANMRNWVNGHAQNGHVLINDGATIEVDDKLWGKNTDLIDDDAIPEFLQRSTNANGEKLDTLPKIFDFLNGVTKKDGDFGTDKARTAWKGANTPE